MEQKINKEEYRQFEQETYNFQTTITKDKLIRCNEIYLKQLKEEKYDEIDDEEFREFIKIYIDKFNRFNNNKYKILYCVIISLYDFLKINIYDNNFKKIYDNDDIKNNIDKKILLNSEEIFEKYKKIFDVNTDILKLKSEEIKKIDEYKEFYKYFLAFINYYKSMYNTYYSSKYSMITNFKIKEEILIKILNIIKVLFTKHKDFIYNYIDNLVKQYNYIYFNCNNNIIDKLNKIIINYNENNTDKIIFNLKDKQIYCPLHLYYQHYITQPNIFNNELSVKIRSKQFIIYRLVNYISYILESSLSYFNFDNKSKLYEYIYNNFDKLFKQKIINYDIINLFNIVDISKIKLNSFYYAFSLPQNITLENEIYSTKLRKQNDFFINNIALDFGLTQENIGIIINLTDNAFEHYLTFHKKGIFYQNDIIEHSLYYFDPSKIKINYNYCYNDDKDFLNCLKNSSNYHVITFKKWPDADIPDCNMYEFLEFIKYINYIQNYLKNKKYKNNISVHCFAGIGRTGTLITCLDLFQNNLNEIKRIKLEYFDKDKELLIKNYNNLVLNYFTNIRLYRPRCIQTVKQLLFISNFLFALSNNMKISKNIYGQLEFNEDYNINDLPFKKDFDIYSKYLK